MARKPRIEYAGATYHVMSRGNQRQDVYLDDRDRWRFLDTMEEVTERTGWRTFAFVLMPNHYHWLFTTPEPNLVAGMKWLQGTYTQRFNRRHDRSGHLFQGRYKALLVDPQPGYAGVVANYVHLNPVRAGLIAPFHRKLVGYRWSSYPACLRPSQRPSWLDAAGLLELLGYADDQHGRRRYRLHIQRRLEEISHCGQLSEWSERWENLRSDWCFGPESFRDELLAHLDGIVGMKGKRSSYVGEEVRRHDHLEAHRLLTMGLQALHLDLDELASMRKSAPEKQALAWLIRKRTCVSNNWIASHLQMGRATNLSRQIQSAEIPHTPTADLRERIEKMMKI